MSQDENSHAHTAGTSWPMLKTDFSPQIFVKKQNWQHMQWFKWFIKYCIIPNTAVYSIFILILSM